MQLFLAGQSSYFWLVKAAFYIFYKKWSNFLKSGRGI
jgi:hypothetical protein